MRVLLGTTPVPLPMDRTRPIIQNLGPGMVYVDSDPGVSAETGFQVAAGEAYEFAQPAGYAYSGYFMVSDSEADVRMMTTG